MNFIFLFTGGICSQISPGRSGKLGCVAARVPQSPEPWSWEASGAGALHGSAGAVQAVAEQQACLGRAPTCGKEDLVLFVKAYELCATWPWGSCGCCLSFFLLSTAQLFFYTSSANASSRTLMLMFLTVCNALGAFTLRVIVEIFWFICYFSCFLLSGWADVLFFTISCFYHIIKLILKSGWFYVESSLKGAHWSPWQNRGVGEPRRFHVKYRLPASSWQCS